MRSVTIYSQTFKTYIMIKKLQFAISLGILAMANLSDANAQVIFSENFNNPSWKSSWTLIDNDGNTPNANVAIFTDAWIALPDSTGGDSAAASTSWYTPAGTSDDYLISPVIALTTNNQVSWDGRATDPNFRDGYELRISTTTPTIAGFMANPALFTIANENNTSTRRVVDLGAAGYANQNVYLAWINNSTDLNVLLIDNIVVETAASFDVQLVAAQRISEYALLPNEQSPNLLFAGIVSNGGSSTLSNVELKYTVLQGTSVVFEDSSSISTLAPGDDSLIFDLSSFAPSAPGDYTVQYEASHDSTDNVLTNNILTTQPVTITDTTFSRAFADSSTTSLGIGAGTAGELGSVYQLISADTLTNVQVYIRNGNGNMTNQPLSANIRAFSNGLPGAILASSDTITYTNSGAGWANLTFMNNGGMVTLPADSFFVGIVEGDSNITIGTTPTKFVANTNFVTFGTTPWTPNENFNFLVTYLIRANFGNGVLTNISDVANVQSANFDVYPNPSNGEVLVSISNEANLKSIDLKVLDIQGKVILEKTLAGQSIIQETLDLTSLDKGIYFIQTITGQEINTKKVILK